MKNDLFSSILAAIVGALIAFFGTNMLIGDIQNVTFPTINATINANLAEPSPEIFNYRSLNPTVEVYVGECDRYDDFGQCVYDEGTVNLELDNIDLHTIEPTDQETE